MTPDGPTSLDEFTGAARGWLSSVAKPRRAAQWGVGPDSVAVFCESVGLTTRTGMVPPRPSHQRRPRARTRRCRPPPVRRR